MTIDPPRVSSGTRDLLREARRWLVLTGSGISAESGIPTFRGAEGLWKGFRAEELASPEGFARDPARVWAWYRWRLDIVRGAQPNAAHLALVTLASHVEMTLVTQNVDGLHQSAGSRDVLELHGSIRRVRCSRVGCSRGDGPMPESSEVVPGCACGARLRPAVVWFGEALPPDLLESAMRASARCEAVLAIGTSSLVYPAAALPYVALNAGATVVEINPDATPLTADARERLGGGAATVLPDLVRALFPQAS
jgi:NAD-dependent deacetylase